MITRNKIILLLTFFVIISSSFALGLNVPEFSQGTGQGFGAPAEFSPTIDIPEEELQELYDQNEESISAWMQQDFGELTDDEVNELIKATIKANLDTAIEDLNNYEWPTVLVSFLGNERVSVYFDGEYELGVTLKEGKVTRLSDVAQVNPTLRVYVYDEFLTELKKGNLDIAQAFSEDWVVLEGNGISGTVKVAGANIGIWIWSRFN